MTILLFGGASSRSNEQLKIRRIRSEEEVPDLDHPKYRYFLAQIIPLLACDFNHSWQRVNKRKRITLIRGKMHPKNIPSVSPDSSTSHPASTKFPSFCLGGLTQGSNSGRNGISPFRVLLLHAPLRLTQCPSGSAAALEPGESVRLVAAVSKR